MPKTSMEIYENPGVLSGSWFPTEESPDIFKVVFKVISVENA